MLYRESWSTKSVKKTKIGSLSAFNENAANAQQILIAHTGVIQVPSAVDNCTAQERKLACVLFHQTKLDDAWSEDKKYF